MPFVPSEKEYELVFIREGERVVIPCRGSVENLNVTLYTVRTSLFVCRSQWRLKSYCPKTTYHWPFVQRPYDKTVKEWQYRRQSMNSHLSDIYLLKNINQVLTEPWIWCINTSIIPFPHLYVNPAESVRIKTKKMHLLQLIAKLKTHVQHLLDITEAQMMCWWDDLIWDDLVFWLSETILLSTSKSFFSKKTALAPLMLVTFAFSLLHFLNFDRSHMKLYPK